MQYVVIDINMKIKNVTKLVLWLYFQKPTMKKKNGLVGGATVLYVRDLP